MIWVKCRLGSGRDTDDARDTEVEIPNTKRAELDIELTQRM